MDDLIISLKSIGFTEYESKVFLAAMQGKLMSASEIAESARIRRTDVYKVLNSFVERGICNSIETNSITKYEVIEPDIVFDKFEKKLILESQKKSKVLKETLEKVKPLYRTKAENNNNGVVNVELIRGFNQHREVKFIELLKNARKEILFMVQPEYFTSEEVDEITLGFFKKGGKIKSIYQAGEEFKYKTKDGWINGGVNDLVRIVENFVRLGENARITDETVPNITIFDRETVFININDKTVPRHNEADVIFRTKDFANSMTTVFNSFWEKSKSVKEYKKSLKNIKTIRK